MLQPHVIIWSLSFLATYYIFQIILSNFIKFGNMGCLVSTPRDAGGQRRRPGSIGEVVVYIPGFRIPKSIDFTQSVGGSLPKNLIDRISALRTRIVVMAAQESPVASKLRRKTATRHGESGLVKNLQKLSNTWGKAA